MSNGRGRVSAVIFNPDKTKLLLMHRISKGKEYWVFPGGGREPAESEEDNLRREVKEEVNLEVSKILDKFYFVGELDGVTHPAFVVETEERQPKLAAGPETKKDPRQDWYNPEWIELSKAVKIKKLYPSPVRGWLIKRYGN